MKKLLLLLLILPGLLFSQADLLEDGYTQFLIKQFSLPANAAGYLLNDGSGGLSWAAVSLSGYLKADRSIALTGVTGPALITIDADEKFATLDGVAVGQVLVSQGTTTAPAYSASPSVTSLTATGTVTANNVTASPTLGDELITFDGTAGSGTNFTWDAGWTWGSGKFTHNAGGGVVPLTTVWVPTDGAMYKIVITSTDAGTGDLTPSIGGVAQPNITSSTTTTFYVTGSAIALTLTPTSTNWSGTITSVSIKLVTQAAVTASSLTINSGQSLFPIGIATYPTIASTINPDTGLNLINTGGQFVIDGTAIGNWSSSGLQLVNTSYGYVIGGGSSYVGYLSDGGYAKIMANYNTLRLGFSAAPTGDQILQTTASKGTDKNGGSLTIQGGQSTGTGTSGSLIMQTAHVAGTGTTANTYYTRQHIDGKVHLVDDNTATAMFSVANADGNAVGGYINYTVEVTDGTDIQLESGTFTFAAVNKATETWTTDADKGTFSQVVSGGTLAVTWAVDTATADTMKVTVLSNSSLTPTSSKVQFQIFLNSPKVITIL